MDKLLIKGPSVLKNQVPISCSKNAYLPILAAVLLNPHPVELIDIPRLKDIETMLLLLSNIGVEIEHPIASTSTTTHLCASQLKSYEATYDLVRTMRASILVLSPLLARFGRAKVSLPGGCSIGGRPINIHLENLQKLGVKISLEQGYVQAHCQKLTGAELMLPFPSVGATENLMMAATLAHGKTVIKNAAREPEVEDLGHFLQQMGVPISGIGSSVIEIEGVEDAQNLKPLRYRAIEDRIEAATYMIAALITQSQLEIVGARKNHLDALWEILIGMGAKLEERKNSIMVFPSELRGTQVQTAPYPGLPTDVQAQLMALLTQASGPSIITENIFENRFMHVPELRRMGAKIALQGNVALVEGKGGKEGKSELTGAQVMCTDLRASAALVLAALRAKGTTEVRRIYHLDRGYEAMEVKFSEAGAQIERV